MDSSTNNETVLDHINEIFETHDIYRCLIIYDTIDVFENLKTRMIKNDYTFSTCEQDGRIYALHVDYFDACSSPEDQHINWDSINVVLCMGEESFKVGWYLSQANDFIEHVIKLCD